LVRQAPTLARLGRGEDEQQNWAEVEARLEGNLGTLPTLPLGDEESVFEAQSRLIARVGLGAAKFRRGDYEGCAALMSELTSLADHPSQSPEAHPVVRHFLAVGKMWLTACDKAQGAPSAQIKAMVVDTLMTGSCTAGEIGWGFRTLAELAAAEGDEDGRYLYVKDWARCVPSRKQSATANEHLEALDQARPDLADRLGQSHSDLYMALDDAGLVTHEASGVSTLKIYRARGELGNLEAP
jgi:hypothetical protein